MSDLPSPKKHKTSNWSAIWVLPLVALAIGAWLGWRAYDQAGVLIQVRFESSDGIQAKKTEVLYKGIAVGKVVALDVSEDIKGVVATIEMDKEARQYLSKGTRFWLVKPRVSLAGVTGLETLVSGVYIAVDPVKGEKEERNFTALKQPPPLSDRLPGLHLTLKADRLGSLEQGSPVFYRQIQVGQVKSFQLGDDQRTIEIKVHIEPAYADLVRKHTVVQGFGREAGEALATSKRIAKIAFTGSTPVGSHILKCAAENIIPSTVELGGKSPNIYFEDIMQAEPAFIEKAAEGLVLAFFNQGEVCTCPSRALVQESIYPAFMEEVLKKVRAIKRGDPLDTETMVGAQASQQQYEKILSYLDIAQQEGAEVLTGGSVEKLEGNLASGYYIQPTLLKGHNKMRVFQEEIFGPVVGVTTFKDEAEALAIANDTEYGLGAGLWTRDINRAYRMGRGIKAGRVWTNCYHLYPAHAAFGGYKKSGVGRETHKMMLDHYQQTKNLLVSYDIDPLGFF
ncbi:aldehyde dehydrogenase family protein [Pseudomonas aeruginosa]